MEDFDEAEEQNEEDLLELGDANGNITLKVNNNILIFIRPLFKNNQLIS